MQQHYIYLHTMIRLPTRSVLTVVPRTNRPMTGNGSTAEMLTLGMKEKNIVRVMWNEDPSEKRLMHSQLIRHYCVDTCCASRGSKLGENMGRGTGNVG